MPSRIGGRYKRRFSAMPACVLHSSPTTPRSSRHGIFRQSSAEWLDLGGNSYKTISGKSELPRTLLPHTDRGSIANVSRRSRRGEYSCNCTRMASDTSTQMKAYLAVRFMLGHRYPSRNCCIYERCPTFRFRRNLGSIVSIRSLD